MLVCTKIPQRIEVRGEHRIGEGRAGERSDGLMVVSTAPGPRPPGAGLRASAADPLRLSPPPPAEDASQIEKYPASSSGCAGGKCLVDVRGQRSDWAVEGSGKSGDRW